MTLLMLMNLGFGMSGSTFNPAWALNRNQFIGVPLAQPVKK